MCFYLKANWHLPHQTVSTMLSSGLPLICALSQLWIKECNAIPFNILTVWAAISQAIIRQGKDPTSQSPPREWFCSHRKLRWYDRQLAPSPHSSPRTSSAQKPHHWSQLNIWYHFGFDQVLFLFLWLALHEALLFWEGKGPSWQYLSGMGAKPPQNMSFLLSSNREALKMRVHAKLDAKKCFQLNPRQYWSVLVPLLSVILNGWPGC